MALPPPPIPLAVSAKLLKTRAAMEAESDRQAVALIALHGLLAGGKDETRAAGLAVAVADDFLDRIKQPPPTEP